VNSRSHKAAASASAGSPAGNFEQTKLSVHNARAEEMARSNAPGCFAAVAAHGRVHARRPARGYNRSLARLVPRAVPNATRVPGEDRPREYACPRGFSEREVVMSRFGR
jgi:hypothetical protein